MALEWGAQGGEGVSCGCPVACSQPRGPRAAVRSHQEASLAEVEGARKGVLRDAGVGGQWWERGELTDY